MVGVALGIVLAYFLIQKKSIIIKKSIEISILLLFMILVLCLSYFVFIDGWHLDNHFYKLIEKNGATTKNYIISIVMVMWFVGLTLYVGKYFLWIIGSARYKNEDFLLHFFCGLLNMAAIRFAFIIDNTKSIYIITISYFIATVFRWYKNYMTAKNEKFLLNQKKIY